MKDRTHSLVSIIGMGLLILTILTTGCTQKDDARSIGMAVEFNNHAACAYVAKDNGWYGAEGINLTTYESYATGMRLTSALARGDIKVAYICLAPAIMAYARGVPLVIVSGTHKHGYGLVASPGITNISDLNGATIGCVREGGMVDLLLNRMIQEYNLKDVRIQRMEPLKQVIALETGRIDAAFLPEHHATVAESKGFTMIITSHELWHEMQGSVLVVKRELIEDDPETVRRLVRVTERATTWINENPDDTSLILAEELDTDPEIIRRSISRLNYTTEIDPASVQEVIDYMVELGYIEEGIKAEDMIDAEFMEGASV
ncbi:MAG: nitrate ABC transporter substrate-binding protein [ANME-2 cluster archaeon]|nr:MAG: nitrate ABC transporter substrate-binding protein [ANME-2 cluster archaeon]